ncbi:MAG: glycosyltransferase [Solirubrobacteraceae bacterium]
MRILVFHAFLLRGTGSNVYNARLCAALAHLGHEVDLFTQDRHPGELGFVDAIGTWEGGEARVEVLREPVRVTAWRPDIGGLLPVYVADRYEGVEARTLLDCTDAEVEAYVAANVAAIEDVVARARPDVALANHLVMGPAIVARALRGEVPYAVKVHGSALECTGAPWSTRSSAIPSASCPGRGRAWRAPGRSSWARGTPPRACGRRSAIPTCPRARDWGRRASTSRPSGPSPTRRRGWPRSPTSSRPSRRPTTTAPSPATAPRPPRRCGRCTSDRTAT